MLALRCTAFLFAASFLACGEENPNPLVNDDINWQLGCSDEVEGCNTFRAHNQASEKVTESFTVSCRKQSTGLYITITDSGDGADERPKSVLRINDLRPDDNSCTVSVSERYRTTDAMDFVFRGTCSAGDCTVSGQTGGDWDFMGTITCDNLEAEGGIVPHTLVKGGTNQPVSISVDNCD